MSCYLVVQDVRVIPRAAPSPEPEPDDLARCIEPLCAAVIASTSDRWCRAHQSGWRQAYPGKAPCKVPDCPYPADVNHFGLCIGCLDQYRAHRRAGLLRS